MARISEIGGRRLPFLRWSFVRMMLGMKRLTTEWQVGDGREEALAQHVLSTAVRGDLDSAIAAVDDFAYGHKFLINVGDEKGALLDAAVRRAQPKRLLELGTYCGYSALRTARVMPDDAHLYSLEFLQANADIARRILSHAGVDSRVTVIVGTLGDDGKTIEALEGSMASPTARSTSCSSTTRRTSTCPTWSGSSLASGSTPARSSSPTT